VRGGRTRALSRPPGDDPLRAFTADAVTAVTLEIGGGTQRSLMPYASGSFRKAFVPKTESWEILLGAARESAPRYEKYLHAQRGDLYRLHVPRKPRLPSKGISDAAPRVLRKKLAGMQLPPAFVSHPRASCWRDPLLDGNLDDSSYRYRRSQHLLPGCTPYWRRNSFNFRPIQISARNTLHAISSGSTSSEGG